jgi:hypothetical protein
MLAMLSLLYGNGNGGDHNQEAGGIGEEPALKNALNQSAAAPVDLATSVRRRFAAIGGVDLRLPARQAIRQAPDLRK